MIMLNDVLGLVGRFLTCYCYVVGMLMIIKVILIECLNKC